MSHDSGSIPKMMDFFADISRRTFSTSMLKKITTYAFMVLRIADSVFSADSLREGLQKHFHPPETALFAPAMHTGVMSSGTRVAVTSARDMGQTACLITSYNHPSSSSSSSTSTTPDGSTSTSLLVEREENTDKDMKIWEAALATSAAPFYLPPFEKPETSTKYVDGAVYANCPAQVAYAEIARIWPDDPPPLDALVSLGTGQQQRRALHPGGGGSTTDGSDVPGLVNVGFFVSLRAMFRRQLDSKSSWAAFRDSGCPASARCRLRRLDPPLGRDDYVELYDHGEIEALKTAVGRWAGGEEAAREVEEIANSLLANLFFFEPEEDDHRRRAHNNAVTARGGGGGGLLSDPSLDTLRGSIRCRLGHGTPELKRLLGEMVDSFHHVELPPPSPSSSSSSSTAVDVLAEVARVPEARWEKISLRMRGRDARPGEMLVVDDGGGGGGSSDGGGGHGSGSGTQKFRLPYTFGVRRGSAAQQVLAVKLRRCGHLVPISGFPATLGELQRRAKMGWLQ